MTEEAGGKGASEQGEQALPLCRGAERNMGIKPRPYFGKLSNLLGRLSWGGVQALFQLPPCPSRTAPLPEAVTVRFKSLGAIDLELKFIYY